VSTLSQFDRLFEDSFVWDESSATNVTVIPSQDKVTQQILDLKLIRWETVLPGMTVCAARIPAPKYVWEGQEDMCSSTIANVGINGEDKTVK
jgi:hypothetical protein